MQINNSNPLTLHNNQSRKRFYFNTHMIYKKHPPPLPITRLYTKSGMYVNYTTLVFLKHKRKPTKKTEHNTGIIFYGGT